jgi:hypothetical protein
VVPESKNRAVLPLLTCMTTPLLSFFKYGNWAKTELLPPNVEEA